MIYTIFWLHLPQPPGRADNIKDLQLCPPILRSELRTIQYYEDLYEQATNATGDIKHRPSSEHDLSCRLNDAYEWLVGKIRLMDRQKKIESVLRSMGKTASVADSFATVRHMQMLCYFVPFVRGLAQ